MLICFKKKDGSHYPKWEEKKLGTICKIYQPQTISKSECINDGIYDVFGANGIIGKYSDKNHDTDQTCVSCRGANCGTVNYVKAPVWITGNSMVCNIDDNTSIMKKYLYYNLCSKNMNSIISGGAQPQITQKDLSVLTLSLAIPEEQQRIADYLSKIDEKIEAQEKIIADYEEQKKGLMQKIFSQEIKFKRDDGTDYPEWEESRLCNNGTFNSGVCFNEKFQGHKNLDIHVYKVSDMNNIGNEKYMINANNTIDDKICKEMKTKVISKQAIIFAKVGAAIFMERKRITTKKFITDNNMMAFIPNSDNDIEFLYYLVTFLRFSMYAQEGALPSYNASDIGHIKVKIPCLLEQKKIADCLSAMDRKIEAEKKILDDWKEFKRAMLQELFKEEEK